MNTGCEYRSVVQGSQPRTLASFMITHYGHSSAAEWEKRIRDGRVLLNGRSATPGTPVVQGDRVIWCRPPWREPAAPLEFGLLHTDRHLLAVEKPPGLPTLPGAGFLEHTLLHQVRLQEPEAVAVHRLGRWTSGIVLFARSREARAPLAEAWRSGKVEKHYRALAGGQARSKEFEVRVPIGPVPHPLLGTLHAASAEGKPAVSRVTVLEQHGQTFLAEVKILTGRPHQIRIHLAAAGHPLAGDPLYGPGGTPYDGSHALPGDPGYRLHAAGLSLQHPFEERALRIRSDPPPALRRRSRN